MTDKEARKREREQQKKRDLMLRRWRKGAYFGKACKEYAEAAA